MLERLQQLARDRGWLVAAGPATVVAEALADVAARARSGELDAGFEGGWLKGLREPGLPPDLGSRAVIVAAVPCPGLRVSFETGDSVVEVRVPPTYGRDARMDMAAVEELKALLPELRGDITPLRGPRKAVAARLGLTAYGRNNITYAGGLGSYVLLCAALTGPTESVEKLPRPRGAPAVLDACAGCDRCVRACPTGAIARDRFLLRAERCLVAFNEAPGPWPPWLAASAHNCLVGCMACQEVCPVNEGRLSERRSGVTFGREETRALLGEAPRPGVGPWPAISAKLAALGLEGYLPVVGRNLKALLRAQRSGPQA